MIRATREAIESHILKRADGCWEWTRALTRGYGYCRYNNKNWRVHRLTWFWRHGMLPVYPRVLDHLCRNRACCNPDHLEEVSLRENIVRGEGRTAVNAKKNSCKNGHPFNAYNTYWYVRSGRRTRACRTCMANNSRRYKARTRTTTRETREKTEEQLRAIAIRKKDLKCSFCGKSYRGYRPQYDNHYCSKACLYIHLSARNRRYVADTLGGAHA